MTNRYGWYNPSRGERQAILEAAPRPLPVPTTGDAGKVVTVNEDEDGYELDTPSGGGLSDVLGKANAEGGQGYPALDSPTAASTALGGEISFEWDDGATPGVGMYLSQGDAMGPTLFITGGANGAIVSLTPGDGTTGNVELLLDATTTAVSVQARPDQTAPAIAVRDEDSNLLCKIDPVTGDVEIAGSGGFIMKDADGDRRRLTFDGDGVVSAPLA